MFACQTVANLCHFCTRKHQSSVFFLWKNLVAISSLALVSVSGCVMNLENEQ